MTDSQPVAAKRVSIEPPAKRGSVSGDNNGIDLGKMKGRYSSTQQSVSSPRDDDDEPEPDSPKPRQSILGRMSIFTSSTESEAQDVATLEKGLTVFQLCKAATRDEQAWRMNHIANSMGFNSLIGGVITINAVLIGLETDLGSGDELKDRMTWFLFECVFNIVFTVEMLVRQNLDGWRYFLDPWNLLDYHLIVLGFVDICMSLFVQKGGDLRVLTAFRIIRMLRLVRNIRLLRMFREIWIIVRGMYDVLPTLGWISVLLALCTYCGAVYVVMGVGKDPYTKEHWMESQQYIGSILMAMYSLFEVITFDNWADRFVRPLSNLRGDMLIVLSLLIIWCSFGIMNVIVGVIVERTFVVASENEDQVVKKIEETEHELILSLASQFSQADVESDEQLTQAEFNEAVNRDDFKTKLQLLEIPLHEVEEVFYILDTDHSGSISCEEFVNGLRRIKGQAQGKDLVMLCSLINRLMRRVNALKARADRFIRNCDQCMSRLDVMWRQTSDELQKRDEGMHRLEELSAKQADKQKILEKLDRHTSLKFPRLGTPMEKNDY